MVGLFVGYHLGVCYFLWFRKREKLSPYARRYVMTAAGLGIAVMLWFFVTAVINLVYIFTLT